MKKRILSLLLALALVCSLALTVSASETMPNLSETGSITFVMKLEDVLLDGGRLNLYKVGDIVKNDGSYGFRLTETLAGTDVDLSKPTDPEVAKELLSLVTEQPLSIITAPIAKGKAVFTDLPVGLYLVWQEEADATEGFSPLQPFLISVPRLQGDEYLLDVVANPKVPLETEPTTPPPPPPPPPPHLPQTGQLNWPVPVMAVLGCLLFVLGLVLYSGRKVADDEA